ncbi:MAG: helix-turn-helix domain-containing protein [Oscillospiraceae bacterium]|nr:helix-turn-helix domain-containing protein [Oscillospiraceae bacterium]
MKKTEPGSLAGVEAILQKIAHLLIDISVPAPAPPEMDYSELNYKNLEEAAKALGYSVDKLRTIVHREDFPGYKVGERWYIPKAELAEWNAKMAKEKARL